MNKNEMKRVINQEFGFATNKIVLLEASQNSFGKYDYIMFEVCHIEYQMNFDYEEQDYKLIVWKHPRITCN